MKLIIPNIINKHKNQKCILAGHGPSLNKYRGKLSYLKDKGYIIIGCNTWYEFYNCAPHYWINVNTVDTSTTMIHKINEFKSIWVYADSVDLTDQEWLNKNIQTDYLPYDQRHQQGKECYCCKKVGCGKYRDPNRLTIQEELKKYTNHTILYSSGHTVALHMLAFSIIMGFSEIYIAGFDFNYKLGYATNTANRKIPDNDTGYFNLNSYGGDILKDIVIINDSAKNIGTKIYNTNENSSWKDFEYKEIIC